MLWQNASRLSKIESDQSRVRWPSRRRLTIVANVLQSAQTSSYATTSMLTFSCPHQYPPPFVRSDLFRSFQWLQTRKNTKNSSWSREVTWHCVIHWYAVCLLTPFPPGFGRSVSPTGPLCWLPGQTSSGSVSIISLLGPFGRTS